MRPHSKANLSPARSDQTYPARDIFYRWTNRLREVYSPLLPGTTTIIFQLLFPEEDHHRKYDMQETRLSTYLTECFGVDPRIFKHWCSETSSGCLGEEVKLVLEKMHPTLDRYASPLSLTQINELLDELASMSGYSHVSIRKKYPQATRRDRLCILKALFRTLSPTEASFLTQIILKDLRPALYPLHEAHYTISLIDYNTKSIRMLTHEDAMNIWDPSRWMLNTYRVKSTIEEAAYSFELPPNNREPNIPCIGTPVAIPKSEKGRDPRHALQYFRPSQKVWAETKYDGERAQIHVEIRADSTINITIFSKSKRDSTLDRKAVHDIIYRALGLTVDSEHKKDGSKVKSSIILDAEMVACHGDKIDEFWRIRGLVEHTAYGIRGARRGGTVPYQSCSSQNSMMTDCSDSRHLALVFFDILALNATSFLTMPYSQRRAILESVIHIIPGESMLAERIPLTVDTEGGDRAQRNLEKIFSNIIAAHQEGIILKGDDTKYHDFQIPWVKLKKDYIPGYGDALDLVAVGAGWDKERARILRVGPATITTLYIGVLTNAKDLVQQPSHKPHFEIYFTVSYGLTRHQLEEMNFLIKNSESVLYNMSMSSPVLPYTFTLLPGLQLPTLLLKEPLLVELFGAGFTKAPTSRYYELRFPRISKIYRAGERGWRDAVDSKELNKIAYQVVGRDNSNKKTKDICSRLWGKSDSPNTKSSLKRKSNNDLWEDRLAALYDRSKPCHTEKPPVLPHAKVNQKNLQSNSALQTLQETDISTTYCFSCSSPGPLVDEECASNQVQTRTKNSYTLSLADSSILIPRQNISLPRMKIFNNALVWFAKPSKAFSELSRSLRGHIPHEQRLHSLQSLLLGCGWHVDSHEITWVVKGIIFVDNDQTEVDWAAYVLNVIKERRATLPTGGLRKPIWIFDIKSWNFDRSDMENQALLRLD